MLNSPFTIRSCLLARTLLFALFSVGCVLGSAWQHSPENTEPTESTAPLVETHEPPLNQACGMLQDQIWVVSTRCWAECANQGVFQVGRYDGCQFQAACFEDLVADIQSQRDLQNVLHVHGNFTDYGWSLTRGLEVYRNAVAGVPGRAPVRFIIWSWESERTSIPVRDFKIKTSRSVQEGYRLAQFSRALGLADATLIGYSMGAQIALTSLARIEPAAVATSPAWRVLLVAPAIAPEFCCDVNNSVFDQRIQCAAILTNRSDRALKNARRLYRVGHEATVDQFSLPGSLGLSPGKLTVCETGDEVGHQHSISRYSQSSAFRSSLAAMLQGATLQGTPATPAPTEATPAAPQATSAAK